MKAARVFSSLVVLTVSGLVLIAVIIIATLFMLPNPRQLETCFTTTMYQVYLCPTSNNYVPLHQISPYVLHAVIAAEDGTFYSHDGFDWHEMEESLNADLKTGKFSRGGSTLTQQLAKNAFLDKDKSLLRKLKEAYLAFGIEKHYTKDFILEKYLNVVEFGPNIYGVKPAAQHYFHKAPSELTPLEAAYLAFLLPNAKVYGKSFNAGKLTPFGRKMVSTILKRMEAFGKLSPAAYQTAINNIGNFPWTGLNLDAFKGEASYSLDAKLPADFKDEPVNTEVPDEDTVDEVLKEERQEASPLQKEREEATPLGHDDESATPAPAPAPQESAPKSNSGDEL